MITSRHITKIVSVLTALAFCLCLGAMAFPESLAAAVGAGPDGGVAVEYEEKLFGTEEPLSVNILMDAGDWEDMLENAISEEYYQCDVEINGQAFYRVGIRPKGNTSLTSIVNDPDTDRYSLKLEFDQYVDGQTCWGLDKLILNNNYGDATNRKEALIYDMFRYLGADASLYNYAKVSVNGEYWGAYLALEAVEDSFLLRNYGVSAGELYKPDSMEMGGGNLRGGAGRIQEEMELQDQQGQQDQQNQQDQAGQEAPLERGQGRGGFGGPGGSFGSSGGADLNYSDDDLDSYSTIWDGEVTDTSQSDHRRVVEALKQAAQGEDLETCLDVDNLLRYMAVHVFSVNQDSLSGNMAHNYYLYEQNGRLNLIPWDYNLALGGMGGGSASAIVNDAIDTPFAGTEFFDCLLENEETLARYHEYLRRLVEGYLLGGEFDAFCQRAREQLDPLVESDPTAFYTPEEYEAAVEALGEAVTLRGESILGQLEGSIPSTDEGQQEDPASLVDASSLVLSAMGTMNQGEKNRGNAAGNFTPGQNGGELPEGFDPSQNGGEPPEGFDPSQNDGEPPEGFPSDQNGGAENSAPDQAGEGIPQLGGQGRARPEGVSGMEPGELPGESGASQWRSNAVTYGACFALLLAALLFVKLFPRRSRRR